MAWVVTRDGIKTEEQLRNEHEAEGKISWICQFGHSFLAPPPHKLQEPPDCPECKGLAKFLSTFPAKVLYIGQVCAALGNHGDRLRRYFKP